MKKIDELKINPWPWSVATVFRRDGYPHLTIHDRDNGHVEYDSANCNLIAAAPELYECFHEAVIEKCNGCDHCGGYPLYECSKPTGECFVQKWRAALAKAAGESEVNREI